VQSMFLSAELGELRPDVSGYHDVRIITASAGYILLVRTRAFTSGNSNSESKNMHQFTVSAYICILVTYQVLQ
jgi:hypothetical protein